MCLETGIPKIKVLILPWSEIGCIFLLCCTYICNRKDRNGELYLPAKEFGIRGLWVNIWASLLWQEREISLLFSQVAVAWFSQGSEWICRLLSWLCWLLTCLMEVTGLKREAVCSSLLSPFLFCPLFFNFMFLSCFYVVFWLNPFDQYSKT